MMGGSIGGGSSSSQSNTEPGFNQLNPGLTGAPISLMQFLGQQIGQPANQFGGQFAGALTPQEQQLIQGTEFGNVGQDFGAGQQLSQTLGGDFLNSNPYIDDVVASSTADLQRNFDDTILPGLENAALTAGSAFSSRYPETVAQAGQDLSQDVSDVSSQIRGDAYSSERDRQIAGVGLAPSISGIPFQNALAAQPLAGLERTEVTNPNLQGQYGEFIRGEGEIFQIAQAISNLLASSLGGTAGESSGEAFNFNTSGGMFGG